MKGIPALIVIGLCSLPLSAMAGGSSHKGAQLYAKSCAMCHGQDGKAVLPGAGDMTDPKGPLSQPDAVLVQHTLEGVGNMPAFKGQLTKTEVEEILGYMRKAFGVVPAH